MAFAPLSSEQVKTLTAQGCTAADWAQVTAAKGFDAARVRNVNFVGSVALGANGGTVEVEGVERSCGISNATIANCVIGSGVLIENIGSALANLKIEDNVVIQNVALIVAEPGAACGNGVEAESLNEGGGRELKLFNGLNSQIAYLHSIYRHNGAFIQNLEKLIDQEIEKVKGDKVTLAAGACITNCGTLRNVAVGPAAVIKGAQALEDGTVNSCPEHPTKVGSGVVAESFILSEGASVDCGAILGKSFVGQGTKMGKQYSAENSVYFANCEAFHGEGCAIFAGPYTVTHHKSTLMIASMFSFYNAGSGTNQSNHMYKLGPVHQGIFERGSKTGSFSYVLLEGHIGAFSVVIGKHMSNFALQNMPFSYILDSHGTSLLMPALNLTSIGTVRDGEKWPNRDKRKANNKRDLIVFDVYSPYTVEKMRNGVSDLKQLEKNSSEEDKMVAYGGAFIQRKRLAKAAAVYQNAIDRYLYGKVLDRIEAGIDAGKSLADIQASLKASGQTKAPTAWTDISGLLALSERMKAFEAEVAAGKVASMADFEAKLRKIYDGYSADEWDYVCAAFEAEYGKAPEALTAEEIKGAVEAWNKASETLSSMILVDSKKEYNASARIGYGLDQDEADKVKDFEAVRGTAETNKVVKKIESELESIKAHTAALKEKVAKLG